MWASVLRLPLFIYFYLKCLKHCCAPHCIRSIATKLALNSAVLYDTPLYACYSPATNVYVHRNFY